MIRKDLPIRTNLTDGTVAGGSPTITVYANPIVSKVRTNLLGESGGITIPEPLPDPLWNPSYITTSLWLDASVIGSVILDGSSNVSQWLDLSGNNRHFAQTAPSSRPGYASGIGLNFDGIDDRLTSTYTFCNSAPCSVFIVCNSSGSSRQGVIGTRPAAGAFGFILTFFNDTRNPIYAPIGAGGDVSATGSSRASDVYSFERINSTDTIVRTFINTSSAVVNTGAINASSAGTTLGNEDFFPSGFLNGQIRKVLIIEGGGDINTREKIEGWMAHDCGLTANLPSGHPYKTTPPTVFQ